MNMPDGELWVICPFDKTHLVPKRRIERHLEECEKNLPGNSPMESLHRIHLREMDLHPDTCPQCEELDRFIADAEGPAIPETNLVEPHIVPYEPVEYAAHWTWSAALHAPHNVVQDGEVARRKNIVPQVEPFVTKEEKVEDEEKKKRQDLNYI